MIIKGGFHNTTKTQVRKTMKYLGITRSQLERELVEQGATTEDGMIMPLYRWFAMHPTADDPLDPKTKEKVEKYNINGRDRLPLVKVILEQTYRASPGTNLVHDLSHLSKSKIVVDEVQNLKPETIQKIFNRVYTPQLSIVNDPEYLDHEPNPNNSDGLSNAQLRERAAREYDRF